ncbi:CPBP family intramembrane glutamic endopeptidase [Staphylococcus americanisciuri]|uniref:CPBP family intramembrane metalloprotease n=1 Tax=Staphylococcus americanisciuri TaxID=2973940 RepID=A0ABT2F0T0_9STAP|nr:CPBP family intramembrane glutamic endopeptidase [Staphylococcus americanisciuri]MCS4486048.1 CPBP family intramembrane metalloprotease [Staphylococcus americanisciuri]
MSKYRWGDIAWRDFWTIPLYMFGPLLIGYIMVILIFGMFFMNLNPPEWLTDVDFYDAIGVLSEVASNILIIICFWLMHYRTMPERFQLGLQGIRSNWLWIIIGYIAMTVLSELNVYLIQFLPEVYQYDTPQNEMAIEESLDWNVLLPFNFLLIAILAPIVEEILFRHLLIGELGKKFNFYVMAVISTLAFAGVHVIFATSPFEIIDYLILAVPLVWVYMKSGRNLGVSIALHILNNTVAMVIDIIYLM